MAYQTPCMSCKKLQSPTLDISTNQVYCSECNAEIPNVSHFFKVQMKTLGQTRKAKKSAYAIRCVSCKNEALPKLDKNRLVCQTCNRPYDNISRPFEIIIRDKIAKGNDDI